MARDATAPPFSLMVAGVGAGAAPTHIQSTSANLFITLTEGTNVELKHKLLFRRDLESVYLLPCL